MLVHHPRLVAAERPCGVCGEPFAAIGQQFCSARCKRKYRLAVEKGQRLATLYPGITDADNHARIPRCKVCHTLMTTPLSISRGRCRPCYATMLVNRDNELKARNKAIAQKRLDAFRVYEEPHLRRPAEDPIILD